MWLKMSLTIRGMMPKENQKFMTSLKRDKRCLKIEKLYHVTQIRGMIPKNQKLIVVEA